jgi:hypothetical protein
MRFYWLILGILTVWRITHLIQAEDGPWDIILRIRKMLGARFLGRLMDCFYCLSIWISAPIALLIGETTTEIILLWPSLSAGAMLLEKLTNRQVELPPAEYIEDEEDKDGMLR